MWTNRRLRAVTICGALAVAALVAGLLVLGPTADDGEATENPLFDSNGELALAMPSLADDISVTTNDDGSATVDVSFTYDVAHPGVAQAPTTIDGDEVAQPTPMTPKPDMAFVTVQVSSYRAAGGPLRLEPMFKVVHEDRELTETETTSEYSIRIPPSTVEFLRSKGLSSSDQGERAAALDHIDIDVQHLRDWQSEDGTYDWQQGRAYTAADKPARAATITDSSTLTVQNSTDEGVYGPSEQQFDFGGKVYDADAWGNRVPSTGTQGVNVALSGQAVECIDQGGGSNPQGFASLNGWDIEDDLPPGVLPPGAAVTQQINADDGLGTTSLDIAENTTAATVQTMAAVADLATGGVKDAATYGYMVALGLADISSTATVALGVPILAILGLADGIYKAATNSCASFANVFNLTVAEPNGAQTSVSWGDQTDGMDLTYESASAEGTPVTGNVMTVPSNDLAVGTFTDEPNPIAFHPYLVQDVTTGCGTGDRDSGECESSGAGNNYMEIQWSTLPMCPYSPASSCTPTSAANASQPEVTVPGTDLCGTDNALCPPVAAPNSDAAESSLTEIEAGSAYQVVAESNPANPVTAFAVTDDDTVWAADSAGRIYEMGPFGTEDAELTDNNGAITAMVSEGATLLWADDSGRVFEGDTADSPFEPTLVGELPEAVEHITPDGNGLYYLTSSTRMWAYSIGGEVTDVVDGWDVQGADVASVTASPSYLFVGFDGGWVERCELTDCPGTWAQIHDDGFDADVQAMTTVGNTLYLGLSNGAQIQMQSDGADVQSYVEAMGEGAQVAGMVTVDGNVFVGGCIGILSPVSGDLLGVEVLSDVTDVPPDGNVQATIWPDDDADYQDCQNPDETTTEFKGFDAQDYALVATPATDSHPPLVFVAFTINSGNFAYVLESTADFTDALCLPDDGECPTAPAPPQPPPPPPPAGSLAALGPPLVAADCGSDDAEGTYAAATADAPLTTAVGESVTTGFQLTAATSDEADCSTVFAWNTNVLGSLPYQQWKGNAYPAASTPGAQSWAVGAQADLPLPATIGGESVVEGDASTRDLTALDIAADGSQLGVSLGSAEALVLQVDTPQGTAPASLVINADVLTTAGQAVPPAVPLFSHPGPADPVSSSTTTSTSAAVSSTTTTTVPTTTTTTQPPACLLPDLPVASSTAAALWPLDDRSSTAADATGNGNDATIVNAAAYDQTPGPLPGCPQNGGLRFDGTTVTAPSSVDGAVTGSQTTAMAWVQVPASGLADGTATVMANDDPASSGNGLSLAVEVTGGAVTGTTFELGFGTGLLTVAAQQPLAPGTWHLLVAVYDAGSGIATIYVDGAAVATATAPAPNSTLNAGAEDLTLGLNPVSGDDPFRGLMANVAVFPRAITAQQVDVVWAAGQTSG